MLWWRRRAAPKGESASEETSGAETGSSTPAVTNPRAKIDKSGLYDLAQVKRLLDDEMIEVSCHVVFVLIAAFLTMCLGF